MGTRGHPFIQGYGFGATPLPPSLAVLRKEQPWANIYEVLRNVELGQNENLHETCVVFEHVAYLRTPPQVGTLEKPKPFCLFCPDASGINRVLDISMTNICVLAHNQEIPLITMSPECKQYFLPPYCESDLVIAAATPVSFCTTNVTKDVPKQTTADEYIERAITEKATCPISMEPIERTTAVVTTCFHVFEKSALRRWVRTKSTCPVCRCSPVKLLH